PALLLLLGAEVDEVGRADVGVDAEAGGHREAEPRLLLRQDRVEAVVTGRHAAVLLRDLQAEQVVLAGLDPDVPRDGAVADHLLGPGTQHAVAELADRGPERLVVLGEDGAAHHRARPSRSSSTARATRLARGAVPVGRSSSVTLIRAPCQMPV